MSSKTVFAHTGWGLVCPKWPVSSFSFRRVLSGKSMFWVKETKLTYLCSRHLLRFDITRLKLQSLLGWSLSYAVHCVSSSNEKMENVGGPFQTGWQAECSGGAGGVSACRVSNHSPGRNRATLGWTSVLQPNPSPLQLRAAGQLLMLTEAWGAGMASQGSALQAQTLPEQS